MSEERGIPRFRYTIRGLMIIVAVAAVALTWVLWARRPRPSPVSGTISFNGQPVASGKVVFLPRNPAGQQASSPIIGGKFSLTALLVTMVRCPAATTSSSSRRASPPGTDCS